LQSLGLGVVWMVLEMEWREEDEPRHTGRKPGATYLGASLAMMPELVMA
jgi:hypothetical protein